MASKQMNALEKLKLAKRTGARATDVELATKKIYDEVTEEQYESVVAKRRKEGNFVVGDDDLGYGDDGEEHGEDDYGGEEDEEEAGAALPAGKQPAKAPRAKPAGPGAPGAGAQPALTTLLSVKELAAPVVKRTAVQVAAMDDLLDEIEVAAPVVRTRGRVAAPVIASPQRASGGSGRMAAGGAGGAVNPFARGGGSRPAPTPSHAAPSDEGLDGMDEDAGVGEHAEEAGGDGTQEGEAPAEQEEGPRRRKLGAGVMLKTAPSLLRAQQEVAAAARAAPVAKVVSADETVHALNVSGIDSEATPPTGPVAPPKSLSFERIRNKGGAEVDTCLFYWLDAHEDPYKAPGVLHVFGKVMLNERAVLDALRHNGRIDQSARDKAAKKQAAATGAAAGTAKPEEEEEEDLSVGGGKLPIPVPDLVSACLTVTGNLRCMFILPRETNARTGESVSQMDVYKELKDVALKSIIGAGRFGVKPVKRNYAFELAGVPREVTEYFKLVYSATLPQLSGDTYGDTFSHVFGGNTTCMEHFMLKRRLLGPCWLRLAGVKNRALSVSHCQVDVEVDDPKCVTVYGGMPGEAKGGAPVYPGVALRWSAAERRLVGEAVLPLPNPDLSVLSLSLKTILTGKGQAHEIVAASLVLHKAVSADGTSDERRGATSTVTFVRHPTGNMTLFPAEFRAWVTKNPAVRVIPNEKALLVQLLAFIGQTDPDVLAGHNISGFDLDVLLQRIQANGLGKSWSRLGRLRRDGMPRTGSGVGGRTQFTGVLTAGRLLCDTYLAARELVRETTYSMAGLAVAQLGMAPGAREDIEPVDVPRIIDSGPQGCIKLVLHTAEDAWLAMRLMFKLQVLPLTKQLTNAAGNLWARSLKGARAERIEYLLLHEFHRLKFVVPDKERYEGKADKEDEEEEEEEDDEVKGKKGGKRVAATGTAARHAKGRGKPAYAGGLVLEPKKGLYDKLVLLLDFNSLYPSIIQEYNLCFTTVDRQLKGKVASVVAAGKKAKAAGKGKGGKTGKRKAAEGEEGGDGGEGAEPTDGPTAGTAPEEEDNEILIPAIPDPGRYPEQGVLPRVIRSLVDKRKVVKRQLAAEKDEGKKQQLDIRQKAIKILANSMYGCLGFSHSRFHAKPIAALVTFQGRDILQKTVNLAINNHGLDVIYGDTDSVMIYTGMTDLAQVKEKGEALKREINKLYKCLEIDIDGIFAMMLLLKKKKYASLKVEEIKGGGFSLKREVKGLDMVRRDWCRLSKGLGDQVLDIVLNPAHSAMAPKTTVNGSEDIVDAVYKLLEARAAEMRGGRVALDQFIITKGLNKHPNDYPDAKSQPHLQVAIAMQNSGRPVNVGDHIPYLICVEPIGSVPVSSPTAAAPPATPLGAGAAPSGSPDSAGAGAGAAASPPVASPTSAADSPVQGQARVGGNVPISQRAYHPDDFRRAAGRLHVDVDWYMTQQILPPIARLCEGIAGSSAARLAECLGLDASRFNRSGPVNSRDDEGYKGKYQMTDEERFKACEKLVTRCIKCGTEGPFLGVLAPTAVGDDLAALNHRYGLQCSKMDCDGFVAPRECVPTDAKARASLPQGADAAATLMLNGVVLMMRRTAVLHQAGWLVCEDAMCGTRTRAQSGHKAGYACTRPGCNSLLRIERPSSDLHDQLEYLSHCFEWERACKSTRKRLGLGWEPPRLPNAAEAKEWRDLNLSAKDPNKPKESAKLAELLSKIWSSSDSFPTALRVKQAKDCYDMVAREVRSYLSHCASHFVDAGALFKYVAKINAAKGTEPRFLPPFTGKGGAPPAPDSRRGASRTGVASSLPSSALAREITGPVHKAAKGSDGLAKRAGTVGFIGITDE